MASYGVVCRVAFWSLARNPGGISGEFALQARIKVSSRLRLRSSLPGENPEVKILLRWGEPEQGQPVLPLKELFVSRLRAGALWVISRKPGSKSSPDASCEWLQIQTRVPDSGCSLIKTESLGGVFVPSTLPPLPSHRKRARAAPRSVKPRSSPLRQGQRREGHPGPGWSAAGSSVLVTRAHLPTTVLPEPPHAALKHPQP